MTIPRTIGLIGGMTYHSTVDYYKGINDGVAAALGGHHSARVVLSSVDFEDVRAFQDAGDWDGAGRFLASEATKLVQAGAQAVAICTNLMHKAAPIVEDSVDVPLIHIADSVAAEAKRRGLRTLGVMGAKWTMRDRFYSDRLATQGLACTQAGDEDIELTNQIIFEDLTFGIVREESRQALLGVAARLAQAGADAVVLACTELPLALQDGDGTVPLLDSTKCHVNALLDFILASDPSDDA
ncbi:MAG: amino acid racemase [Micrococcales bacterium]|nr:amino acid racemase [Micrococcales bacterium]